MRGVSPCGTQEDQAEHSHQTQIEVQSVQRNSQLGVNFGKEKRRRKTAISAMYMSDCLFKQLGGNIPRECVDHATARSHDGDGSKENAYKREPAKMVRR